MTATLEELSRGYSSLVSFWTLIIICTAVYVTGRCVLLRIEPIFQVFSWGAFLASLVVYTGLILKEVPGLKIFPFSSFVIVLLGLSVTEAALLHYVAVWSRRHISPRSVKESLDNLPTGLCYYLPGGLVKLSNARMEALCLTITGRALRNAEDFWNVLTESGAEEPILVLPEGNAWSFHRNELTLEGKRIYELIAADVTEEQGLRRELEEQQKKAAFQNARLKGISSNIKYLAMEQEALRAKIRIHDRLGQGLLMIRRYVSHPEEIGREEILGLWNENLTLLRNEGSELWQEPYFTSYTWADHLGVKVTVEGTLPAKEPFRHVIETAINVHVTNVVRHAQGNAARIRAAEEEGMLTIRFTNNGIPPAREVSERGGLLNLRKETEALGGELEIRSLPEFELILRLPAKGETEDGV